MYGENKKEFKVNVAKTFKNDSRFNMEDKKVVELHPDSEDLPDIDKVIDSSVKKEKIGRGGVAGR